MNSSPSQHQTTVPMGLYSNVPYSLSMDDGTFNEYLNDGYAALNKLGWPQDSVADSGNYVHASQGHDHASLQFYGQTTTSPVIRRDFQEEEEAIGNQDLNCDTLGKPPKTRALQDSIRGTIQKNFVRKLYDMLNDPKAQKYIRWNSDGASFTIENQDEFAKKVLGKYLKTENFQSFIRQLNMYDFHKINKAVRNQRGQQPQTQQYVFSHPKFRRGEPELLESIKRKGTEQQDPPPYSETLKLYGGAYAGLAPGFDSMTLRFPPVQNQAEIALRAELDRLRQENNQLRQENSYIKQESSYAHNSLKSENDNLKLENKLLRSQLGWQETPKVPSVSPISPPFAQSDDKNPFADPESKSVNYTELAYSGLQQTPSAPFAVVSTYPSIRASGTLDQTQLSSSEPHQPAAGPSTNMNPNTQSPQLRQQPTGRPTSWVESMGQWFHSSTLGLQHEAEPSTSTDHPNQNISLSNLGKRSQPVMRISMRSAK